MFAKRLKVNEVITLLAAIVCFINIGLFIYLIIYLIKAKKDLKKYFITLTIEQRNVVRNTEFNLNQHLVTRGYFHSQLSKIFPNIEEPAIPNLGNVKPARTKKSGRVYNPSKDQNKKLNGESDGFFDD